MYSKQGIILAPAVPVVIEAAHPVMNCFFSVCFVATFHNVKYWGPSPLTFPLRLLQFHAKALLVEKFNTTVM